jgi:hypothetical protein
LSDCRAPPPAIAQSSADLSQALAQAPLGPSAQSHIDETLPSHMDEIRPSHIGETPQKEKEHLSDWGTAQ